LGQSKKQPANSERPKGNRPVYIARARQNPDSDFFTTIGAAWNFKQNAGLVVKLNFLPLDGQFVLVEPKEEE
jgi:hypothetical protein